MVEEVQTDQVKEVKNKQAFISETFSFYFVEQPAGYTDGETCSDSSRPCCGRRLKAGSVQLARLRPIKGSGWNRADLLTAQKPGAQNSLVLTRFRTKMFSGDLREVLQEGPIEFWWGRNRSSTCSRGLWWKKEWNVSQNISQNLRGLWSKRWCWSAKIKLC